jgi:hypothetical protein
MNIIAFIGCYFNSLFSANASKLLPFAVVLLIVILPGCAQLYKINTVKGVNTIDTIEALKTGNKQFIIHLKDTSFMLANYYVTGNRLEGDLLPLHEIQRKYLHPKSRNKNSFSKEHAYEVLNEVHLYATNNSVPDSAHFSIPVSALTQIDINQKNVEATKRSHVVGSIIAAGTIIGAVILLGAIAASSFTIGNFWGG